MLGARAIKVKTITLPDGWKLGELVLAGIMGMLLSFILAQSGTWLGLTQPAVTLPTLLVGALLTALWLYVRTQAGSQWHSTPLDAALPLWLLAFAISTAANEQQFPYIGVGLWFVGLYLLVWYIVFDGLANQLLKRHTVVDGLLVAGLPTLTSALYEFCTVPYITRAAGMLRNPNILAAFLVLLLPLLASRIQASTGYGRVAYGLYALVAGGVLLLSQSRGGLLGVGYSFVIMVFYHKLPRSLPLVLVCGGLVLGGGLLGLRGDSGRLPIYMQAISVLPAKFLTGQGLFTFRTIEPPEKVAMQLPPDGQNLHAHNIWLQIAVELGSVGILALAVTIIQVARLTRLTKLQQWSLAALAGLLVQQMVDFTVMVPAIALCTLMVLGLACASPQTKGVDWRWPVWLLGTLAIILLSIGCLVGAVPLDLL